MTEKDHILPEMLQESEHEYNIKLEDIPIYEQYQSLRTDQQPNQTATTTETIKNRYLEIIKKKKKLEEDMKSNS